MGRLLKDWSFPILAGLVEVALLITSDRAEGWIGKAALPLVYVLWIGVIGYAIVCFAMYIKACADEDPWALT
jgi:hypothetical protein